MRLRASRRVSLRGNREDKQTDRQTDLARRSSQICLPVGWRSRETKVQTTTEAQQRGATSWADPSLKTPGIRDGPTRFHVSRLTDLFRDRRSSNHHSRYSGLNTLRSRPGASGRISSQSGMAVERAKHGYVWGPGEGEGEGEGVSEDRYIDW
jgi:hypothetical protein